MTPLRFFPSRALLASVAAFAVVLAQPVQAQDAADILLRLDRLESENRRLTGQIEELRYKEQRLEEQLKRFQNDADMRFRDIEGGKGGGSAPLSPRIAPAPQPGKRADAFDPAQGSNAPGAPRPLGAPAGNGGANGTLTNLNPGGGPTELTPGANPAGANPAAPGSDAGSSFTYARGLIERGEYENGEVAMRDFLKKYGRDKRAPEATFWIGESYLRRTRYREAAENFLTVTTKHSGIAKAPEAMLKLGISLRGLGANAEACGTFDQVGKKYPNASPAIKAAVTREKTRANCAS